MQHGKAWRLRTALVVTLGISGLIPGLGVVQEAPDPSGLTLQQAVDEALLRNPGIRAAGYEIDIARARGALSALPAPMSVQTEVENVLGTGEANGFDRAETTLQLTKVLELGGKRDLRAAIGSSRVMLAETGRSLARIDLAAEVARRFIRLAALQEEASIAALAVELAESTLAIVRQGVSVGGISEAELATSEIALARAGLELDAIETRIEAAGRSLAALWDAGQAPGVRAEARIDRLPPVPSFDSLAARVDDSPGLIRAIDERRVLEAERRLARTRERGDLELGFGVRHLGEIDDTALVFGASLPLGNRDRSAADVTATDASLEQLSARTAALRLDALATLAGLHAEIVNADRRHTVLTDSLLPLSEEAAQRYRQGFELGSFSLLEFSQAQQDLLDLRREALAAAERYHTTLVDIEQLLGGTYEPGVLQ